MRLKPTSFLAIYADGLVQLEGHAFKVGSRELVVHKTRPQLQPVDKNYKISSALGFGIPISPTKDRREAVAYAYNEVPKIGDDEWSIRCQLANGALQNKKLVED